MACRVSGRDSCIHALAREAGGSACVPGSGVSPAFRYGGRGYAYLSASWVGSKQPVHGTGRWARLWWEAALLTPIGADAAQGRGAK